ncbi:heme-binding protein [Vibrio sp. S9_S30]|uniref:GlcG/HbpS family heme-binding protein n=1 Tax=Vibrio sp. S9_S30 TaxID=2720226 RepID=UPI001680C347|nr:heme-binding protein [Vibrio sp. S9_S30]MBD1557811.1 heme-binding protein [Vibrio sp. S9_S30]
MNIKHTAIAAALTVTGLMSANVFAAESKTVNVANIASQTAFKLAMESVNQCHSQGYRVSTTVVDTAGRVVAQLRADNAGTHTLESSRKKAFTAASMKQPTANLMKTISEKPILQPLKDMDDNLLLLAGGIPLKVDNQIIGAIGVGGAPGGHLDVACAEAAIKKVL